MKCKIESAVMNVHCFLLGCLMTFLPMIFLTTRYVDYSSADREMATNKQFEQSKMLLDPILRQDKEFDEWLNEWLKRKPEPRSPLDAPFVPPEPRSPLDAPVVPLQQGNPGTG